VFAVYLELSFVLAVKSMKLQKYEKLSLLIWATMNCAESPAFFRVLDFNVQIFDCKHFFFCHEFFRTITALLF